MYLTTMGLVWLIVSEVVLLILGSLLLLKLFEWEKQVQLLHCQVLPAMQQARRQLKTLRYQVSDVTLPSIENLLPTFGLPRWLLKLLLKQL